MDLKRVSTDLDQTRRGGGKPNTNTWSDCSADPW